MTNRSTWELKAIVKALSMLELLNTNEENKRLEDAKAEYIITCDGAYRGAKDIPLKSVIDDALIGNKTIKRVIVCTRTRTAVSMLKGRDVWWEDEIKKVEKNGNYIHLGFFINGTPIQVFNEDESVKSIKGISYLVFKKGNEFYYVKNTSC